jgi:hypothetical protein
LKTAICTISTQSHIYKVQALYQSLLPFYEGNFFCLLIDAEKQSIDNHITTHDLNDLVSNEAQAVKKKYKGNKLRWALKSIYLKFVVNQGFERVLYVDNDICFYGSPQFLFDKLIEKSFLLTPHFYPTNPQKDQNWLEANYRVGLYNAGFIGVSKIGVEILDWWTNCCLYNVKKSFWRGLFDDQKYLDLVPVKFEDVEVVKHRGCNLAGWNSDQSEIVRDDNGQFLIQNEPLIFIHFTPLSFQKFSLVNSILFPAYQQYLNGLKLQKNDFQFSTSKWTKNGLSSYFYYLRWRFVRLFEK